MGLSPKLQTSCSSDENLVLAQNPSLNNHFLANISKFRHDEFRWTIEVLVLTCISTIKDWVGHFVAKHQLEYNINLPPSSLTRTLHHLHCSSFWHLKYIIFTTIRTITVVTFNILYITLSILYWFSSFLASINTKLSIEGGSLNIGDFSFNLAFTCKQFYFKYIGFRHVWQKVVYFRGCRGLKVAFWIFDQSYTWSCFWMNLRVKVSEYFIFTDSWFPRNLSRTMETEISKIVRNHSHGNWISLLWFGGKW